MSPSVIRRATDEPDSRAESIASARAAHATAAAPAANAINLPVEETTTQGHRATRVPARAARPRPRHDAGAVRSVPSPSARIPIPDARCARPGIRSAHGDNGKDLDGRALGARIRAGLADDARALVGRGVQPGLAVVLVGEDPASQVYVRSKTKACQEAGFRTFDHILPETTSEAELLALVAALNANPEVDGILVQLPLPAGIDARRVLLTVDPAKDVDGFHPENLGRLLMGEPRFIACTPFGS